jgi:hypothetical protein
MDQDQNHNDIEAVNDDCAPLLMHEPTKNKIKQNETNMRWVMLAGLGVLLMGPYFCID